MTGACERQFSPETGDLLAVCVAGVQEPTHIGGVLSPKPCKQFFWDSFFLNFKNFTYYLKFENKISKFENF